MTKLHAAAAAAHRARDAMQLARNCSHAVIGALPNLYKLCREGVDLFDSIRDQIQPDHTTPAVYGTLIGQQQASMLSAASLDDVKSLLVFQVEDGWHWTVIGSLDNGRVFILGSPHAEPPFATRDECIPNAMTALKCLGATAVPAPDYVPIENPENYTQIRLNDEAYYVPNITDDEWRDHMQRAIHGLKLPLTVKSQRIAEYVIAISALVKPETSITPDGLMRAHVLTLLAACGWHAVSHEILDRFVAANNIDRDDVERRVDASIGSKSYTH